MVNPSIRPVTEALEARRGRTFQAKVTLYEDEAKTKRLNLAGLTVHLVIDGYLQLSSGAGLTINAATGEVTVSLTPAQTAAAPQDEHRYFVTVEESPAVIVEPLVGPFMFATPGA